MSINHKIVDEGEDFDRGGCDEGCGNEDCPECPECPECPDTEFFDPVAVYSSLDSHFTGVGSYDLWPEFNDNGPDWVETNQGVGGALFTDDPPALCESLEPKYVYNRHGGSGLPTSWIVMNTDGTFGNTTLSCTPEDKWAVMVVWRRISSLHLGTILARGADPNADPDFNAGNNYQFCLAHWDSLDLDGFPELRIVLHGHQNTIEGPATQWHFLKQQVSLTALMWDGQNAIASVNGGTDIPLVVGPEPAQPGIRTTLGYSDFDNPNFIHNVIATNHIRIYDEALSKEQWYRDQLNLMNFYKESLTGL